LLAAASIVGRCADRLSHREHRPACGCRIDRRAAPYRLAIPGAYFAAAIFALHPVQVESVAWVTEIKNTLSAVFYLGAAIAWLHYREKASRGAYLLALGLFVLALCTKTVTATLPAALLVIEWWRRGRLSWRRDVLPLVPFFILGIAAGLTTVWVERSLVGA